MCIFFISENEVQPLVVEGGGLGPYEVSIEIYIFFKGIITNDVLYIFMLELA